MNRNDPAGEPRKSAPGGNPADTPEPAVPPAAGAEGEAPEERQDIAAVIRERDEYLDMARRIQAEFDNFRKRNSAARQEALAEGAAGAAEAMLPVLDNLERADKAARETGTADAIAGGVELVLRLMREALQGMGVTPIEAEGKPFSPALHEAVAKGPADAAHPAGTVLEVLRKGYAIGDRILRHCMVKVAE